MRSSNRLTSTMTRALVSIATIAVVEFGAGCATSSAPKGWAPNAEEAQQETFGGWIELDTRLDSTMAQVSGEFIAVSADTVFLVTEAGFAAIARTDIRQAHLFAYGTDWRPLGLWTAAGTVSTISHGAFLLFTAPAWLIGGWISTTKEAKRPLYEWPKVSWSSMSAFARFPQGLPPTVSRKALKLASPTD